MLLDDENDSKQVQQIPVEQTEFTHPMASNLVLKWSRLRPGEFELYRDGALLGTYQSEDSFWQGYRRHVVTEGDRIAFHGLGVETGELPAPKPDYLPWELHYNL